MRVLVFGGSSAQGYYDLEMGGWVNLLFLDNMKLRARHTNYPTEIINVSISGNTTRDVINRLRAETEARRRKERPFTLVFVIGLNDAGIIDDKPVSSPEQFTTELSELYDIAASFTKDIIFVGPNAVYEPETTPWLFNPGTGQLAWTNDRIREFDTALRDFAASKKAAYIPLLDKFLARMKYGAVLQADGLHPNAEGHRLIYEQVRPFVLPELAPSAPRP